MEQNTNDMKIEIVSQDASGTRGNLVYCDGKRIQNKCGGIHPHDFYDDDLLGLLGEKRYAQLEKGKYEFNLTKKEIFKATEDMRFYTPIK